MLYIILLIILVIDFIITLDTSSLVRVIVYLVIFEVLSMLMADKCNPRKCKYYEPMENFDGYKLNINKLKGEYNKK